MILVRNPKFWNTQTVTTGVRCGILDFWRVLLAGQTAAKSPVVLSQAGKVKMLIGCQ